MGRTTFSGPVVSTAGFIGNISSAEAGGTVKLPIYAKASVPSATTNTGALIYVSDAATGACPCFSNGTNWLRVDTSAVLS
jgi:hypothetical protein